MHKVCLALILMTACGYIDYSDHESDITTGNPALWFSGTWDCSGGYFHVPPFEIHTVTAVYTIVDDVSTDTIRGDYQETVDAKYSGQFDPLNFGEIWTVGDPDRNGVAVTTQEILMSDGTRIDATGTARGELANGAVIGVTSLTGKLSLDGNQSRVWSGGMLGVPKPDTFFMNRNIEISPRSQQGYQAMTCIRR